MWSDTHPVFLKGMQGQLLAYTGLDGYDQPNSDYFCVNPGLPRIDFDDPSPIPLNRSHSPELQLHVSKARPTDSSLFWYHSSTPSGFVHLRLCCSRLPVHMSKQLLKPCFRAPGINIVHPTIFPKNLENRHHTPCTQTLQFVSTNSAADFVKCHAPEPYTPKILRPVFIMCDSWLSRQALPWRITGRSQILGLGSGT